MALKRLKWLRYLFVGRTEGETEQQYWNEKRKKHLANEHSAGIVTGLEVTATSPSSLRVRVAGGRAVDSLGNDPEVETVQELDLASLVPPVGETTVYIALSFTEAEVEPYFVDEIGEYQNKYMQDGAHLEVLTIPPSAPAIELARVELTAGAIDIPDAADPESPGADEIDLTHREFSGKEVLALEDLADVSSDEAAAFNGMNSPSGTNPVATLSDVATGVAPIEAEVGAARGSKSSLDGRLDTMLNEDGSFKGITGITPAAPLTGGGTAGDVPLGISDATPSARGAMLAADKAKLDGVEAGATADQTAQEVLDSLKTVDGDGSGLDADLLDGSQHRGLGGDEHAIVVPSAHGFMSAADKTKLDGIETGATGDPTAPEILAALKTVDGPASGLDADLVDGKHWNELTVDPATVNHNSLAGLQGASSHYHLSTKQRDILTEGEWKTHQGGEGSTIQSVGSFRLAFLKNTIGHFGSFTFRIHLEHDGGEIGDYRSGATVRADWDFDYVPNPGWVRDIQTNFYGIFQTDAPTWWAFKVNWLQIVPSDEITTFDLTGIEGDISKQLTAKRWDLLINYTFRAPTGYSYWATGTDWAYCYVYFTYYKLPQM